MSNKHNPDWAVARSYGERMRDAELPYYPEIKRASLLCGFYRTEVRRTVADYRRWLVASEYLRFIGALHTPRTHQFSLDMIRAAYRQYRAQMKIFHDLRLKRDSAQNHAPSQQNDSVINEAILYSKLEAKYGPSTAQTIIDEINRVSAKDALPRRHAA